MPVFFCLAPLGLVPFMMATAALAMTSTGRVGLGTVSPTVPLHVLRSDGSANVLVEETGSLAARDLFTLRNNGRVNFALEDSSVTAGANSGREWQFSNNAGTFLITTFPGGAGEREFEMDTPGNVTISGELTTIGSCASGCDRVFDADYPLPTIAQQRDMMFANRHLPNFGPTPEGAPMNLSAKVGGILSELEKAHIYIARQDARIARLEALVDAPANR